MTLLRGIFVVTALTCGAAWLLKMVAIAATGGAESESVVVAVLWTLGMLSFLVSAGAGTALLLGRAPLWARVAAGVAAVPVAFVLLSLLDTLVKSVYTPRGWFGDEVSLVLAGVVLAGLGLGALSERRPLSTGSTAKSGRARR